MAILPGDCGKLPFQTIVGDISDRLDITLGNQQDAVYCTVFKTLRDDFQSNPSKLGSSLLSPSTLDDLMSDVEGNREELIDSILLNWVTSLEEPASVRALLQALHNADETLAVENIVKALKSG